MFGDDENMGKAKLDFTYSRTCFLTVTTRMEFQDLYGSLQEEEKNVRLMMFFFENQGRPTQARIYKSGFITGDAKGLP